MIERQARALGLVDLAHRIGSEVLSGPFQGISLDVDAFPQHVSPKLCGSYEDELHEFLEVIIRREPDLVVNVGCAEGYYAVGLAKRMPNTKVFAFDADPLARKATNMNANNNQVKIYTKGVIKKSALQELLSKKSSKPFVFLDCEGFELDLLDKKSIPALENADIIVETHPHIHQGIENIIIKKFKDSHTIQLLLPQSLLSKIHKAPNWLMQEERCLAVNERRSRTPWLVLLSRRPHITISNSHIYGG